MGFRVYIGFKVGVSGLRLRKFMKSGVKDNQRSGFGVGFEMYCLNNLNSPKSLLILNLRSLPAKCIDA